jgi:hypothetical protein
VGTHAPLARAGARVLVAVVVLAGLFLMHGLPAGNCLGHGAAAASSMTSAVMADPAIEMMPILVEKGMAADAAMAVRPPVAPLPSMAGFRPAAVSPADAQAPGAGMAGAVCVSRPPPPGLASLLALSLLVGAVAVGEALGLGGLTSRFLRGRGLRAPPQAGAALLVRLCISRT